MVLLWVSFESHEAEALELIQIREYVLNLIPPLFASVHLLLFTGHNIVRAMQCSVGAIIYYNGRLSGQQRVT